MTKEFIAFFIMASFFIPCVSAQDAGRRGREIMIMADNRLEPESEISKMKMLLTDSRGKTRERELKMLSLKMGETDYSMIFFLSPADVNGVGLLSIEEKGKDSDQWLYMPALKKTRRIASSSKDENFMGTEFSYEDLEGRDPDDDTHTFLREETLAGKKCWVVESVPRKESGYSKRIIWVEQESLLFIRVDFYNKSNSVSKRLISDIRKDGPYWTAYEMVMTDLEKNRSTKLTIVGIDYDSGLSTNNFTVGVLEQGRVP